jgi:hypothetical protein
VHTAVELIISHPDAQVSLAHPGGTAARRAPWEITEVAVERLEDTSKISSRAVTMMTVVVA